MADWRVVRTLDGRAVVFEMERVRVRSVSGRAIAIELVLRKGDRGFKERLIAII
jgi:hypothetical protein